MTSPFPHITAWLEAAKACKDIAEPTAMSLATCSADGRPSVRIVLLKGFDPRGLVFYTNLHSHKSRDLIANPRAALCFHWMPLERQLRIEGAVEPVNDAEADAYFASRPRESQLGAWASQQSSPLEKPLDLLQAYKEAEALFDGREVTRPPHWSGFRVVPERVEFWQQGQFRMHTRDLYVRQGNEWRMEHLYP